MTALHAQLRGLLERLEVPSKESQMAAIEFVGWGVINGAALLSALEDAEWVSVEERLPADSECVIGCYQMDEPEVCQVLHYGNGLFMHEFCAINDTDEDYDPEEYRLPVTRWKPLPEPPAPSANQGSEQ